MSPNRVAQCLEANIVATWLMMAYRIGCMACQACWQTVQELGALCETGLMLVRGDMSHSHVARLRLGTWQ
jgi:hypothetical protein